MLWGKLIKREKNADVMSQGLSIDYSALMMITFYIVCGRGNLTIVNVNEWF